MKTQKLFCKQAGIKGNKINHSLRTNGVTELYDSGIPEILQDLGVY